MSEDYKIKDKGIQSDTEATSAISTISYEVENGLFSGLTNTQIKKQIEKLQESGKFPANLEYIDSFYDENTSLSGVAFKDTTTGRVTIGFAGTNLDNGLMESAKDYSADGSIIFNGPTDTADYFKEGHLFIQKIKKDYPVETVTGHSKAGRDVVILGVSNDIPNIVTYNPAPVTHEFLQMSISLCNELKIGKRSFAQVDLKQQYLNYSGSIVHLASNKDWLTNVSDLGRAYYVGDRYTIYNGKNHGITGFLTKEEQEFIRLTIAEHTQIGGMVNAEMAQVQTKQSLKELSLLKQQFLKGGGGSLSSAQEVYLDAAQALTLTKGMKETVQNKVKELKDRYQEAIETARELWEETFSEAQDNGSKLTYYEQLEALENGSATEKNICTEPVAEYESMINQLASIEEKYDTLIDQIDTAIKNQVATDQELAQQLRGA